VVAMPMVTIPNKTNILRRTWISCIWKHADS